MNTKIIPIVAVLSITSLFFYSCEDSTYKEYKGNAPVYMSYEDLRTAISAEQNVDLKNPGKIYFKDNFIFIVEELKGIHIFDNTDPSSPVKKVFIKLPGVVDISISGSIMYADSYVDLVVLDVQDVDNIHETGRIKDILPYTIPPTGNDFPMGYIDQKKGVVVDWELKTIKEKVDPHPYPYPYPYPVFWEKGLYYDRVNAGGASTGMSGSGIGAGGSMARFGIKSDVLYVLDHNTIKIFDITNKTNPVKFNDLYPGWGIETMFLTENNMFLGTTNGMVIYDISVPLSPEYKSFFSHATSCDPVIVDDTLAYITLRTGTTCGGTLNSLSVVNIRNLGTPSLVMSYSLTNPHGLGKAGDLLFICDGSAGLKIFDAADPKTITNHLIYNYPGINAYDVIPVGDILVLIGDDGLYQYDYSNVQNISLLSSILVAPE
jgi:hypothetical protein